MIKTELSIATVWNGTLAGVLLKNSHYQQRTMKIVAVHGWLDNLNSMLPLAEKLLEHHPNYEIYLYDCAGHGFSSHLSKGSEYGLVRFVQDLRHVIRTLGWTKENYALIGHSYGAAGAVTYAASYPEEVSCVIAIDSLPRGEIPPHLFWKVHGTRIDANLEFHLRMPRTFDKELTMEKVLELTKSTRPGIGDTAGLLIAQRSIRRDAENKLHFTRDESVKLPSLFAFDRVTIESLAKSVRAAVLFIGALDPQWPHPQETIELFQQHHPKFEMTFIDGPHHLHMTHVDEVVNQIDQYFSKHLHVIELSKL